MFTEEGMDALGDFTPKGIAPNYVLPLTSEPTTLSFWEYSPMMGMVGMNSLNESQAWALTQEKLGVTFDWQLGGVDAATQYSLMIVSGDLPDIMHDGGFYSRISSLDSAVEEGYYLDLNSVPEYFPHLMSILNGSPELKLKSFTDSGYLPLAPMMTDIGTSFIIPHQSMGMRLDLLQAAGWDGELPETFDEYYDILVFVRDNTDLIPTALDPSGVSWNNALLAGLGIGDEFMLKNGEVTYTYTTDEFRFYLETMAKWYTEKLIDPDFMSYVSSDEYYDSMYLGGNTVIWDASKCMQAADYLAVLKNDPAIFVQSLKSPVREAGVENYYPLVSNDDYTVVSGDGLAVSAESEQIELACRVVDWFYSVDGITVSNFGNVCGENTNDEATGVQYYYNGSRPTFTDWMGSHARYYTLYLFGFTTPYTIQARTTDLLDEDVLKANEPISEQLSKSDSNLMLPANRTLTADESYTYSSAYSEISTYAGEMILSFIVGTVPLNDDTWNEYVSNIESLGLADCIAAQQAATDRYNAR